MTNERDPAAVRRPDRLTSAAHDQGDLAAEGGYETDIGTRSVRSSTGKHDPLPIGGESRVRLPGLVVGETDSSPSTRDTTHEQVGPARLIRRHIRDHRPVGGERGVGGFAVG